MSTLTLLVTYTAAPGQRDAFLDALNESGLPAKVRKEAGCLQYDYFRSVDNPDRILLVERWTSPAMQKVHLAKPHMLPLVGLKKKFIAETKVLKLGDTE